MVPGLAGSVLGAGRFCQGKTSPSPQGTALCDSHDRAVGPLDFSRKCSIFVLIQSALFDMVNLDRWVSEYCDANRRRNFPARPDIDGARGFMRPVLYAQLADNMEMTTNDDIFAVF